MESFLGLFNPKTESEMEGADLISSDALPPEPQNGNVEYKLKIINPTQQRFEHLVTQMKWRLREGQGEAIYEIGVQDNGVLTGLTENDMKSTMSTLNNMAQKLDATTSLLRKRVLPNGRSVAEILVRKIPADQNSIEVRIAVLGNADAGKSTLVGVLTQGEYDNGRGKARLNVFRHLHELKSGRTSCISHEILGFNTSGEPVNYKYSELMTAEHICEVSKKLITFLDLAGHRKYLKTTIQGLSGYLPHYAMLVISSTSGIVGTTKEHLELAIALQVPFFIVITKTDLTSPSQTLSSVKNILNHSHRVPLVIKSNDDILTASTNQPRENIIPIFCVSNVNGDGLSNLLKFFYVLPPGINSKERDRLEQEQPEFQIDEMFNVAGVGQILGGLLVKGVLTEGMSMKLGPLSNGTFIPVTVKSIHRNKAPCRVVRAGQSAAVDVGLLVGIRAGMVLLDAGLVTNASMFFQAKITVLYHATAIYPGFQTTIYMGNIRQTAIIAGVLWPKGLQTNDEASVLFRFVSYPEYVRVGMKLLFKEGSTKGVGTVTQVFPYVGF